MVRVMANTSAFLITETKGLLIRFDETGAYPGAEIRLEGRWRTHPPLLPEKKVPFSDFSNDSPFGCT